MTNQEPDWQAVADTIERLLGVYGDRLAADAVDAVRHYSKHDEYEMAFEGLCIELMKLDGFSADDRRECTVVAKTLGLDRESVFDGEFWQKLTQSVQHT